jgi:hypothetical protein
VAVWEDVDGDKYFSCPLNFLSNEVVAWYENYKYDSIFQGSSLPYNKQSAKYIEAMFYYINVKKRIEFSIKDERESFDQTTQTLKTFRMLYGRGH